MFVKKVDYNTLHIERNSKLIGQLQDTKFNGMKHFVWSYHYYSGSQTFSDCVPFVAPVLSSRTTLFHEKSMCQMSFDQKSGKPELAQMQREQNGC